MGLAHVELELAREPGHPFGDRDYVFQLHLPIREDGRLDADQVGRCADHCRFRRRRPDRGEARGPIRLAPGGELRLGLPEGDARIEVEAPRHRFRPGELLPVVEGGERHIFQVLWIRPEG